MTKLRWEVYTNEELECMIADALRVERAERVIHKVGPGVKWEEIPIDDEDMRVWEATVPRESLQGLLQALEEADAAPNVIAVDDENGVAEAPAAEGVEEAPPLVIHAPIWRGDDHPAIEEADVEVDVNAIASNPTQAETLMGFRDALTVLLAGSITPGKVESMHLLGEFFYYLESGNALAAERVLAHIEDVLQAILQEVRQTEEGNDSQ